MYRGSSGKSIEHGRWMSASMRNQHLMFLHGMEKWLSLQPGMGPRAMLRLLRREVPFTTGFKGSICRDLIALYSYVMATDNIAWVLQLVAA